MAAKAILVLDSITAAVYVAAADSLEKDMLVEFLHFVSLSCYYFASFSYLRKLTV
jgi:hypothetical protein